MATRRARKKVPPARDAESDSSAPVDGAGVDCARAVVGMGDGIDEGDEEGTPVGSDVGARDGIEDGIGEGTEDGGLVTCE